MSRGGFRRGGGGGMGYRGGGRGFSRGGGRGRGRGREGGPGTSTSTSGATRTADGMVIETEAEGTAAQERWNEVQANNELESKLGVEKYDQGPAKVGWLVNIEATLVRDDGAAGGAAGQEFAAVDLYFIEDDGGMFKATVKHEPYFYIVTRRGKEAEVEEWLVKQYEGNLLRLARERKEDLKLPNHLVGHQRTVIKLVFRNVRDLLAVRREVLFLANKNKAKLDVVDAYAEVIGIDGQRAGANGDADMEDWSGMGDADEDLDGFGSGPIKPKANAAGPSTSPSEWIVDIREYDVPYYLRVSIDLDIRVGLWYTVESDHGQVSCKLIKERVERAEPVVMAYDIETTKAPLKFPDAAFDQIMMISYMIDGQGFLITNREIVGSDIEDFDYTPKPEYEGSFTVFNEPDETALIRRWMEHVREARPTVMATYNGDSFDFPFVCARAAAHGIDMLQEIGFAKDNEDEFKSRTCIHMDCFRWVKRDSYLPQGSQGLKAVTVAKLGYNPIELDPELMTPYAVEQPQILAQYSVSDAVATYYLYMKYVHPFIFSLCNIIPLKPDEVLRKGSGTLCETLLMVEAFKGNVIMPNRHVDPHGVMYEGHLLENETYVGGHVEALEAGVFRSDIPADFKLVPRRCQQLLDELDSALHFSIVEEGNLSIDDVANYAEIRGQIASALEEMRDNPIRRDPPIIYHLDVAAMYPNIMLSNRLQPDSVVDEAMCAACDYNRPNKRCDRRLTWAWRGEFFPAKLDEYKMVRNALEGEAFPPKWPGRPPRKFVELSPTEQTSLLHKRLGDYSRKVYKKTHETRIVEKEAIICQRENPFYIDTVRAFRDRRYTYKGLHKDWKKRADRAQEGGSLGEIAEAKKMIVLYDSLQLAHKCILNSFYGYVMRKGARWHSMEMAGITCLTGARIIQMAREIIEEVGRPLELDTDGIWCMLPGVFPDNYAFTLTNGKKHSFSYPCSMLNHLVHQKFTNDQYHEIVDASGRCEVRKENSIFFELDGPYKAMILPSSKEEDKLLKKRYAVFNDDGSLAELKGFEVKRRGELQLIKIFQSSIFERFLLGDSLRACYDAVATVANQWLDVLASRAANLHDEELIDLISENRSMSKTLSEYAGQKSTSISTAKRLSEFLGEQMVKDKGLSCRFIISAKPQGAPVTDRAVPVAIFSADASVRQHFLRKWLKDSSLVDFSLRSILDWAYYTERLGSVIQKLITIPAAMQQVSNPVPRIHHPDWLARRLAARDDTFKQRKLSEMFAKQKPPDPAALAAAQAERAARRAVVAEAPRESAEATLAKTYDVAANYVGWLASKKREWRQRRTELASFKAATGSTGRQLRGTIGSMLRQQTTGFSSHLWEVVQIVPSATRPGEFRMWMLVKDSLQSVKLRIPRQFYINFQSAPTSTFFPQSCAVESAARTLPRSQPRFELFRVTVPEASFLRESAAYARVMTDPSVDGTYELQIPLILRALIKLGSTCVAAPGSKASLALGIDRGFDLEDLAPAPRSLSKRRYLDQGLPLRYILVYHFSSGSRHAIAIISPASHCRIVLTDRSPTPQVPNMQRYYAEALAARAEAINAQPGAFGYSSSMRVDVTNVANEEAALKALSRELITLSSQRGASLLVVQSSRSMTYYEKAVPSVTNFPSLLVPTTQADNDFGALGWQRFAAGRVVQHFLRASAFLKERIDQADRFDVPLCNVEGDVAIFLADIDFARRLTKSDHVLWWSPGQRPDLGGREADANPPQGAEDLVSPEITHAGAYSNACLELNLRDLAVDAVLQSGLVYGLEGGEGGSLGFETTSHTLDEYSKGTAHSSVLLGDTVLPAQAFAILRAMLKSWIAEGIRPDGHHFRGLVRHFWRWISSPSARLFEPTLQRFVHGLMCKTFSQLLAEFRRLGTSVVHADFGRLFLATAKPSSAAAYAYAKYIVAAVNGREIFKFLQLDLVRFWDQLVWRDVGNFAGIICDDPTADVGPEAKRVDMQWHMASFLPPAVQQDFLHLICAFVHDLHQCKLQSSTDRTPLRLLPNGSASQTRETVDKEAEADLVRAMVRGKVTRQILKTVNSIKERQSEAAGDPELREAFHFPSPPGSHLAMKNVSLEFVKMFCHVLELAKVVAPEVRVLKRNALDLIGVREFSQEAAFRHPCLPFKLAMVACSHCNVVRSFDLTVVDETFECHNCRHEHDRAAIEASLLEMVQRLQTTYQLQDLRCTRCRQIKDNNLGLQCNCSGEYEGTSIGRADIVKRFNVAVGVARVHRMELLEDFASSVLERI